MTGVWISEGLMYCITTCLCRFSFTKGLRLALDTYGNHTNANIKNMFFILVGQPLCLVTVARFSWHTIGLSQPQRFNFEADPCGAEMSLYSYT